MKIARGLSCLLWLLTLASDPHLARPMVWALAAVTTWTVWKTRIHMLWLLAAGALVGALGWV